MAGYGSPKSSKRNYLVIGLAVFVVALVIYFLFFTQTPDEGTRTNAPLKPAGQSVAPEQAPNAPASPSGDPTPAQAN